MGTRGPVPKRSAKRHRRHKPAIEITEVEGAAKSVPEAQDDLHPLAADWYAALADGPEAQFYSAALWQRARVAAELLSGLLRATRPSSQMYTALQADMKALLVDAGELRRLGIEVQASVPSGDNDADSASVVSMRERRARVLGAS